jgi:hypothetical protein
LDLEYDNNDVYRLIMNSVNIFIKLLLLINI